MVLWGMSDDKFFVGLFQGHSRDYLILLKLGEALFFELKNLLEITGMEYSILLSFGK